MAAREDILEKVKKSRQQAEQRIQQNNKKAMASAQKAGTSYSPSANTVSEYRAKRQQATKWYKGNEPTETETVARIMKLGDIDEEKGRNAYDLYQKSKEEGHWHETYDKATSSYATALGVDASQINDDWIASMSSYLNAGVHTSTGALSTAKKNGKDAVFAANLNGLIEDYNDTKELLAEEEQARKEAQYWMDKGLTDEEIKDKLNIGGDGSKYKGLTNAINRAKVGEVVPTTSPILLATSYGVDGMLYGLRNPESSTGNYFTDAVQRDMGRGTTYTDTEENIARRNRASESWRPYANGTTMDEEAMLLGVNGKEGFARDDAWWNQKRAEALASGDDNVVKAFGRAWDAEQRTRKAETELLDLMAQIRVFVENGKPSDEIFSEDWLDDFPTLKAIEEGYQKGNPVGLTRSLDFDVRDLQKMVSDAQNEFDGSVSMPEYEVVMEEATGSEPLPTTEKSETEEAYEQYKQLNTDVLLQDLSPLLTGSERREFRILASAGFSDVSGNTANMIDNGSGGDMEMRRSLTDSAIDYASNNLFDAWDVQRDIGSIEDYMAEGVMDTLKSMFPDLKDGEIPTQEDFQQMMDEKFNPSNYEAAIEEYGSIEAWQSEKMRFEQQWTQLNSEMQGALPVAQAEYDSLAASAAEADYVIEQAKEMLSDAYGAGSDQYNAAMATYEFSYQYSKGVPLNRNAYDAYQMAIQQEGVTPEAAEMSVKNQRGANARNILVLQAVIENAQTLNIPDNVIANMQRHVDEMKAQNDVLNAHFWKQNEDYRQQVNAFDSSVQANVFTGLSSEDFMRNIVVNPAGLHTFVSGMAGQQGVMGMYADYTEMAEQAMAMTDEEIENFKYAYMTAGADAAMSYFENLRSNLNVRIAEEMDETLRNWAGENVFNASVATLMSVAMTPAETLAGIDTLISTLAGEDVDAYGRNFAFTRSKGSMRTGVKEGFAKSVDNEKAQKVFDFFYDALTSAGDSGVAAASGSAWLASVQMGFGAMQSSTMEASMRGATSDQALLYGIASAMVEFASEKLPFDNIIEAFGSGGKEGFKGLISAMCKNFATEFGEETFGGFAESVSDDLIMGALSNREIAKKQYMAAGLSEEEAEAQYLKDSLTDIFYGGLLGGTSGAMSAGGSYALGSVLNRQPSEKATKSVEEKAKPQMKAKNKAAKSVSKNLSKRMISVLAQASKSNVGDTQTAASLSGVMQAAGIDAETANALAAASSSVEVTSNGLIGKTFRNGSSVAVSDLMKVVKTSTENPVDAVRAYVFAVNTQQVSSASAKVLQNAIQKGQKKGWSFPGLVRFSAEDASALIDAYRTDLQNPDAVSAYDSAIDRRMVEQQLFSAIRESDIGKRIREAMASASAKIEDARVAVSLASDDVYFTRTSFDKAYSSFSANPADASMLAQFKSAKSNYENAIQKHDEANRKYDEAVAEKDGILARFESEVNDLRGMAMEVVRQRRSEWNAQKAEAELVPAGKQLGAVDSAVEQEATNQQNAEKFAKDTFDPDSFIQPTAEHTPEQKAEIQEYHNAIDSKMLEAAELYKNNPSAKNTRVLLSEVGERESADIQRLTGLDVTGYTHTADKNFFRHVEDRHGEQGAHDMSMKNLPDVARVGWVIENYDNLDYIRDDNGEIKRASGYLDNNREHMPLIRYTKQLDGTAYVVEAVGDNDWKRIWLVSAYMQKNSPAKSSQSETVTQTPHAGTSLGHNVQNENASPVDISIADPAQTVNENLNQMGTDRAGGEVPPADGMGVSQFASQTGQRTSVLSDTVKKQLAESPFYQKTTEKQNVDLAVGNIEREGYDTRRNKLLDGSVNLYTPEGQVEAYVLAKVAKDMGDTAGESAIAFKIKESGTLLGQSLAMRRMYIEMTPEGKLQYIQRVVDQINQNYANRRKQTRVEVPSWLAERLEQANGNDDQMAQVIDDAYAAIADQMPPDWRTRMDAWRYTAMLANPRTHIRNYVGNLFFMPAVSIKNKIGAAAEYVFNAKERTKTFGPVKKEYKDFARTQLDSVMDMLTGGGKHNAQTEIQQNRRSFNNAALEWLTVKNGKALEAEDAWFLNRHFTNALAGFLQARNVDLKNVDKKTLQEGLDYAILEAQKATYRDASEIADKLSKFSSGLSNSKKRSARAFGLIVEGALPFKKTPINIMRRGIEYSPVGLVTTLTLGKRDMKRGNITHAEYIDRLASGLTGTGLAAVGAMLYSLGHLKLSLDEPEAELEKLTGAQEYSIELFGKSITIDWLSPSAMPLFVGGAIAELFEKDSEGFSFKTVLDALMNIAEPVFNLSMLDGVNSLLSSASYSENGVVGVVTNAVESYATQFVPSILGAFARILDPVRRTTYTEKDSGVPDSLQYVIDSTINKIPGLSKTGQAYLNAWGEEDVTSGALRRVFENLVSPGYVNDLTNDDVETALMELFDITGNEKLLPKLPSKYFTIDGEKKNLTGEEYEQLTRERGQTARALHEKLFGNADFLSMPAEYQVYAVEQVWEYATQQAKHSVAPSFKMDSWVQSSKDPAASIMERTQAKMKKDRGDQMKADLYTSIDAGELDTAATYVQGILESGTKKDSLRTSITNQYKSQYQELYAAGDVEGMRALEDALMSLNVGYKLGNIRKWILTDKE